MSEPVVVNVTVTFQNGTPPSFTYTHEPAEGVTFSGIPSAHATLSGHVNGPHDWAFIFELAGAGVGDTLVWDTPAIAWTREVPPTPGPGLALPEPSANQIVLGVHNDNTSPSPETFGFRLRVRNDGEPLESPDPEIVLDPPSP